MIRSCWGAAAKPPASYLPIPLGAATLWEQLEKAGIPEVKGVWGFVYGGQPGPFTVIAIKQRYAGHSKQALLVAAARRAVPTEESLSW
jgi:4-hydroxy-3-polyprenylbenzoate decarboxylase